MAGTRSPIVLAVASLARPALGQPVAEWTVTTGNVTMSSPRFADVDGNGVQDVVLATMGPIGDAYSSGSVRVLDASGAPLPGWPVVIDGPITGAALAVADLEGDGDIEIVGQSWQATHVWNHDGSALFGWPKATGTSSTASPALADLDGDGDLEIIVPDDDVMHVWHHTGEEAAGWPRSAAETFQAASVGDVDGDGALEIVAGTWRPQFPDTVPFELHAWEANGTPLAGFPIGNLGVGARGPVSLGDLDGNGAIEIVVRAGDVLHVFDGQGQEKQGWPVEPGGVPVDPIRNATPVLGDLDGDGDLEIMIAGDEMNAFHHTGGPVAGFPVDLGATGNVNSSAVVASIDGNASDPEIVVKIANNIVALHADGSFVSGFPLPFTDDNQSVTFSPSPVIGDVDGDGDVEYAFTSVSGRLAFFDEAQPHAPSVAFWPTAQHDNHNTSLIGSGPAMPGDIDGDGDVDVDDLLALLAAWGACPDPCPPACAGDFDGDCDVDVDDLLTLLGAWG